MECRNCQRLSNDLKNLTIGLKNIKKWIREKLEIEIPRCLGYPEQPDTDLVVNQVEVEDEDQLYEKRLKNHNLLVACLEKKAFVRLERLLPTTIAQNRTQGSAVSISIADDDDYDIDNNDGQNLESRSESEASIIRDISIQNNSDEDGLSPSINTNLKRILRENKRPISSSKFVSNEFKKRKVITSTTTSNIKPSSSYPIEDNYNSNIDKPSQQIKTTLKVKIKNVLCPECGKLLRSTKSLKYHRLNFHAATADQECPHCPKKFTKRGLKTHIQLIHPTDLQRICPFCATLCKNPHLLKRHIKIVHNEDRTKYKCSFPDCTRVFYWEGALKTHVKCHSEDLDVAKPFKCTFDQKCNKRFNKMYDLKLHIKGFHQGQKGKYEQGFVCQNTIESDGVREKCGERFAARSGLKLHNYSVHNQQYGFKCSADGCFQSYRRESLLIRHLKTHEKVIFKECPICLKQINVSRSINRFNRHVESVHGDKQMFSCSFENCGKSCNSYNDLKLHNYTVHGEQYEYKCTVGDCFQSYKHQKSLVSHIRCVHEGKKTLYYKYPCSFENCSKSFRGKAILGIHVKKYHPDHFKPEDYPTSATTTSNVHFYSCTECNRKFQYYSRFVRHQAIHLPGHKVVLANYSCHICNMKFKRKDNVSLHVQAVHSGLKPFACTYENCDKAFALRYYLKHHISTVHLGKRKPQIKKYKRKPRPKKDPNLKVIHQGGKSKRYSCPHENCGMSFTTHSQLKRHNHSVHNDQQYEFKCSFDGCLKSFMKRGYLIGHLNSHGKSGNNIINEKGQIFRVCPICLKQVNVTRNNTNFNKHLQYIHEGKKPNPCPFENCGKSFKSRVVFGIHVKKSHPDHFKPEDYPELTPAKEKKHSYPYSCSECNRKFSYVSAFNKHKIVHTEDRNFSCDFCDLKFKRKTDLPNHVQAVHSGLRPFACTYENCDKAFALKYYLTSHISQVHLGKTRAKPKLKK